MTDKEQISTAMSAIIQDLSKSKERIGRTKEKCGSGLIKCPVCNNGTLSYVRECDHGQVFAACSAMRCISFVK